jgi:oligopeptide transport system substrate-binding protein
MKSPVPFTLSALFGFALSACLFLLGCARRETPVAAGIRTQTLHIGGGVEPGDLDLHTTIGTWEGVLASTLFEGLVNTFDDGKTILPGAAERWTVSPDGLTYTFYLRPDLKWSNGDSVTAYDFRESFVRLLDPTLACEAASDAYPVVGAKDYIEGRSKDPSTVGFQALDGRTFVIILRHPAPYWLTQISRRPFFPVHLPSVDATGGRRERGRSWTRPGKLVGNGPFILTEWRPNAVIRVERNPHYWDTAHTRLHAICFYPIEESGTEEHAYRAGQLHVTRRVPLAKIDGYARDQARELRVVPTLRTASVSFNVTRPPFTDARVRRAFSLAIDRESLVRATVRQNGTPAKSLVRPGTGGYTPPETIRFDPGEARRLLADAGFPGGSNLPQIEYLVAGTSGESVAIAEALQHQWAQHLGARVSIRRVDTKTWLGLGRMGAFQVIEDSWGSSFPDAIAILAIYGTGNPNNWYRWSNQEFDRWLAVAERSNDGATRCAAFDGMESILARECPSAPLYFGNRVFLVHPAVRGVQWDAPDSTDWRRIWLEKN